MKKFAFVVVCSALTFGVSVSAWAVEPGGPGPLIERLDAAAIELRQKLADKFSASDETDKLQRGALVEFYAAPGRGLQWVDEGGLNERARAVAKVFARAGEFELSPLDYTLPENSGMETHAGRSTQWLAQAEYQISRAVLDYVHDAQVGRINPRSLSPNLDLKPQAPDPLQVLEGLTEPGADVARYIEGFQPSHPQFHALLAALKQMREKAANWSGVSIPDGPSFKPGDKHPQIGLVRQRLGVSAPRRVVAELAADDGQTEADDSSQVTSVVSADLYDETLEKAVREFQAASGLTVDAIIGPATRRELNRTPHDKIRTLQVNIERWRWMPRELGERHVRVNIPEYIVRVRDGDEILFEERVIVGEKRYATPVFSDEMSLIEFNPYWHVPQSIARRSLLPQVQRDPGFLSRNNFQVVWRGRRTVDPYEVDWQQVDLGRVSIRQSPGAGNALGSMKFMFPNRHAVYLHDTPTKHLFNREMRAFSNGCIRVRNPDRLAEILLQPQGWSDARIRSVVARGGHHPVRIERTVPVHLSYFTAAVTDDGQLQFFDDIYEHDARMAKAMKL